MGERVFLGSIKPSKPIGQMTPEERRAFAGELAEFFKHKLQVARDADSGDE